MIASTKTTAGKRGRAVSARVKSSPRWRRRLAWTLAVLLVICVTVDLISSPVARSVVNQRLAAMPEFTGRVERIHVSIWRGRIEAEEITFQQRGENERPLAKVKSATLNVAVLGLLSGRVHARIFIDQLDVAIVKTGPAPKKDQDAPKPPLETEHWRAALQKSFPVEITHLEVKNSRMMLIDRTHEKPVEIGLVQFHVIASGLGTKPSKDAELPTQVVAQGVTSGRGNLTLRVQADPLAATPRFHVQFAVTNVNLPDLNDFLLAFAKIDVARGTFEFESEVTGQGGGYAGYVKPFFKDLDFKTASDETKGPLQLLAKKAVAAVAQVFKNKQENKVATKAPISGNFEGNNVDVWTTISNLMRNAFVQAIREGFEGQQPSGN